MVKAKATNSQNSVKAFYAKQDLLSIDEWLLRPLPIEDTFNRHELINASDQKGAIIFCPQYNSDDWYFRIICDSGDGEDIAVTEAILNRLINRRYNVILKISVSRHCPQSMFPFAIIQIICIYNSSHNFCHNIHNEIKGENIMHSLGRLGVKPSVLALTALEINVWL